MFESFANQSKTTPAEWLLARLTGPERAAAIYGDLEELSATRGRLWFWTTYVRTLIDLGWRTPVAFLIAIVSVRIMCRVYPRWVQYELRHLPTQWHINLFYGQLAVTSRPLLNAIAMCLWFALPYAWMRFGRRDRVTQVAGILFVSTLPVFSFREWLVDVSSILTMLILLAAVISPLWRRPLAVLTLTLVTSVAAIFGCNSLLAMTAHRAFLTFSPARGVGWLTTAFALAIAAFVCSRLHRLLLRQRSAIA
jgi:hypothetical protein